MDVIKDFFLEANPNPERKGCPDEQTLKALAENRLPLDHPARLHLASCSECFAEYTGYQGEFEHRQNPNVPVPVTKLRPGATRSHVLPWLVAASLLIVGACGYALFGHRPHGGPPQVQVASDPVYATVDLFNAGTLRGNDDDPAPLREVSLPTAMVHLSVTLPRFSQTGRYEVLVSKDKAGVQVVAMGTGLGMDRSGRVRVDVTLDLRAARAGAYFLATVRGADNGTYYYPLKIN